MKDNLEKAFHDSLKDYQEPYNPKAWENVSAQLGAPASVGGVSGALKWVLTTLAAGAVAFGVYYFWPSNQQQSHRLADNHTTKTKVSPEGINRTQNQSNDGVGAKDASTSSDQATQQPDVVVLSPISTGNGQQETMQHEQESIEQSHPVDANRKPLEGKEKNRSNNETLANNNGNNAGVKAKHYIAGLIPVSSICEGQTITVTNPSNEQEQLVRFQNEGKWIVLQNGDKYTFRPSHSEAIEFTDENGAVIQSQSIVVNTLPTVNFDVNANIFEDGLPVAICRTLTEAKSYQWKSNHQQTLNGKAVTFNFFKEGDHMVTLKVVDGNGCSNEITKIVNIRNKYNLLAVDAFKPRSIDSRTNTFMPYALKVRDVKFLLTIIDPTDNHVVFSSSDANNAWDGIDQTTGKMTKGNKIFVWNVHLENPLPNERPIYVGTVVHD